MEEKKYCVICGKEIEKPRANSKTCGAKECTRKNRINTTCMNYAQRAEDPKYKKLLAERARLRYHNRFIGLKELRAELINYKANDIFKILKQDCEDDDYSDVSVDKMIDIAKKLIVNNAIIDEVLKDLKDA